MRHCAHWTATIFAIHLRVVGNDLIQREAVAAALVTIEVNWHNRFFPECFERIPERRSVVHANSLALIHLCYGASSCNGNCSRLAC